MPCPIVYLLRVRIHEARVVEDARHALGPARWRRIHRQRPRERIPVGVIDCDGTHSGRNQATRENQKRKRVKERRIEVAWLVN